MWPWRDIGHGNYVICSSSYAYSHTSIPENYKKNSFTYQTGDILDFEWNVPRREFLCQKR